MLSLERRRHPLAARDPLTHSIFFFVDVFCLARGAASLRWHFHGRCAFKVEVVNLIPVIEVVVVAAVELVLVPLVIIVAVFGVVIIMFIIIVISVRVAKRLVLAWC